MDRLYSAPHRSDCMMRIRALATSVVALSRLQWTTTHTISADLSLPITCNIAIHLAPFPFSFSIFH